MAGAIIFQDRANARRSKVPTRNFVSQLLLIFTYYMLTKQGKVNYIKYKNKLITKITKIRAIVKPAKEPLAHEVSQSEFFFIFPTPDDTNRLIIVEVSTSKGRGSPPSKKRILLF